jgi:DNA sulfur modification protein DndC
MVESLDEKIEVSLKTLQLLTRFNGYDIWEVGFSGGKDSLVVLHLITIFIKRAVEKQLKIPKTILVVYGDTLVEIPHIREAAFKTLDAVADYSHRELKGIIKTKILRPLQGQDFFTMIIERGYPPPHYRFRWCVPRLKINPFMEYLKNFNGKLVMVTGEREDESATRSRIMNKRRVCSEPGMLQRDERGNLIATPLKHWTKDDVFAFLAMSKQPWNDEPYTHVLDIYGTDELRAKCACGLSPNVRYGCWVCTVIQKDKALEYLKQKGDMLAENLLRAKEELRKIGLNAQFRNMRMNGKYGKLNEKGRAAVATLLFNLLKEAKEGLYGYLEDPVLRDKLNTWIERYCL